MQSSSAHKKTAIKFFAILALGVALGRLGTGSSEDRTVYVDKPGPTITVTQNAIPEYCTRALDMAGKIRDEAGKFDTASGPQLDLISKIQTAIVAGDVLKLNELTLQQRNLRSNTQDAATVLQGDLYNYSWILGKCREELGDDRRVH